MKFKSFLNSIKNDSNRTLIEEVIEPSFDTLLEDVEATEDSTSTIPKTIEETDAMLTKAKEDSVDLETLKVKQADLIRTQEELKNNAQELEQTTSTLDPQ